MDELIETAVFGQQVQNFLQTDIGKYLVGKAEREVEEAVESLKRTAPWRTRRIRQLQNQIQVAEWFQQWLADAILDGENAIKLLED